MMRPRLLRTVVVALAVPLAAAAVTSCGAPSAPPGPPQCAVQHGQQPCEDIAPVETQHPGKSILEYYSSDPKGAENEACASVPPEERDRLLGQPTYAFVSTHGGPECRIEANGAATVDADGQLSAPPQIHVHLRMFPEPEGGYSIVDGNKPTLLAGHPAWVNDHPSRTDREYTVATGSNPHQGGVLFVEVDVDPPRGSQQVGTPADPAPLAAAEPLAVSVLHHLGMQP